MKVYYSLLFLFLGGLELSAQSLSRNVLFLGNSYTQVNNLPQMVADVAASTGDVLNYTENTPGGYTFQGHSTNATSLNLIAAGNLDFVVLQEQSQRPSFPISQVLTDVFPYATFLDSLINFHNPCGETAFYMTWGRKNGDASNCGFWPPVCTYEGMDSLLNLRYRMMADSNDAILSPVGAVWKYIRQNYPTIELYSPDESHPSVAGTYAAACTFYTALFRKDPSAITFNSTLSPGEAADIRAATKIVVFDSLLNWHIGEYDPMADFSFSITGSTQISFTNNAMNTNSYLWDFGDGNFSTNPNPVHNYLTSGTFTVTLIVDRCGVSDTSIQVITLSPSGLIDGDNESNSVVVYPNPATDYFIIDVKSPQNLKYKIINLLGREVYSGNLNSTTVNVSLVGFPEGVYLLLIQNAGGAYSNHKLVKL